MTKRSSFLVAALLACGGQSSVADGGADAGADGTVKDVSAVPDVAEEPDAAVLDAPFDTTSCTPSTVAVCGRDTTGVGCAISNGSSSFGALATWSAEFADASSWNTGPEYYATIQFADVDGDGKVDVCGRGGTGVVCGLSNGTSFATPTLWDADFSDNAGWQNSPAYWATIRFPDVNGDGKADVCGRGSGGILCALSDGTKFGATTVWSNDFSDALGWAGSASFYATIAFPDLDGDGKADVCGRSAGGVRCALSNGSTFVGQAPLPVWEDNFSDANQWNSGPQFYGTIQYADVDGDGKADICGRGGGGVFCATSNGATAFVNLALWDDEFSDANQWAAVKYAGTIQLPDLNGDGKADVCGRSPGGISCALSDGTKFAKQTTPWTDEFSDAVGFDADPRYYGTIQFPDLDGDGRADVCGRGIAGIVCALSDGTKFLGSAPLPLWQGSFGDTTAFLGPASWGTIAFPVLAPGTCKPAAQAARPLHWIARFGLN